MTSHESSKNRTHLCSLGLCCIRAAILRHRAEESASSAASAPPPWAAASTISRSSNPTRASFYVGAAAGGLFKTVNGGITWQAIFEDQPNPSIGDLALAPSNPSILYVGTGEANNRQSSSWGDGVYKSMDARRDLDPPGPQGDAPHRPHRGASHRSRTSSTWPRSATCGVRTKSAAST